MTLMNRRQKTLSQKVFELSHVRVSEVQVEFWLTLRPGNITLRKSSSNLKIAFTILLAQRWSVLLFC